MALATQLWLGIEARANKPWEDVEIVERVDLKSAWFAERIGGWLCQEAKIGFQIFDSPLAFWRPPGN